jgi:hypothetical protein
LTRLRQIHAKAAGGADGVARASECEHGLAVQAGLLREQVFAHRSCTRGSGYRHGPDDQGVDVVMAVGVEGAGAGDESEGRCRSRGGKLSGACDSLEGPRPTTRPESHSPAARAVVTTAPPTGVDRAPPAAGHSGTNRSPGALVSVPTPAASAASTGRCLNRSRRPIGRHPASALAGNPYGHWPWNSSCTSPQGSSAALAFAWSSTGTARVGAARGGPTWPNVSSPTSRGSPTKPRRGSPSKSKPHGVSPTANG